MSARAYRPQPMRTTSPATRRARRWPVTFDTERPTSPAMSQACRGVSRQARMASPTRRGRRLGFPPDGAGRETNPVREVSVAT